MTEAAARPIGAIRKYYQSLKAPLCSSARARADVLSVLEDRKAIQRGGETLMMAALPYSGDPALAKAIEDFRAVLEGRATS